MEGERGRNGERDGEREGEREVERGREEGGDGERGGGGKGGSCECWPPTISRERECGWVSE